MSLGKAQATSVTYRWDDQIGADPGWYCESHDSAGLLLDDSQKIWWPVDVDDYGRDEEIALAEALAGAFPSATIAG